MADDQDIIELDDHMNSEDEEAEDDYDEENGTGKAEDELILKADSDIEEIQEDDTNGSTGRESSVETKETPQTKRDTEFTSEDFKIELRGLPRYYAMGQLKKLLNETLQLKAHKIKPAGNNKDWAYVTFRDEKSRTKALTVLDEFKWKKCVLSCSIAKPVEDPVQAKRAANSKFLEGVDPDAKIPINERVVKSVTPYAHFTYEDQLKKKQKAGLAALRKLGQEMANTNPELKQWVKFHKLRRKGQVCEIDEIVQSPKVDAYRNKCEFTVGINPEDNLPTVGFRVSSYKAGSLAVGPVGHLVHIPNTMKKVVEVFQDYIRSSEHKPFDPLTHEGVWRQLTVRTSSHDDVLIAVVIHPQDFSEEDIGDLKQDIIDYFKDGVGTSAGVTSIFFQAFGQKEPGPEDIEFEHLWGEEYITETVLGKTFRISCESFFQVNTEGCEALYETVASFAELDGTSVILDICCGTGTIGVSLADQCLKVYGIEMVKKAAEDARHNADLNGLANVAIYTGKAEVNMNAVLAQCAKYKTVGVVDPPRAGLPESVIRALRKCENMDRLIYMSCDPDGAFKNFVDLSRPKSKNYKGEFFVPIRAAVVDLFPHTPHYELLILFERWEERKWRRIMEGNPLPRDEDYFKRIPAKPEGEYQAGSSEDEDEESVDEAHASQVTGYGAWQSVSGKRRKEMYQPYVNPRHQYVEGSEYAAGRSYGGGARSMMGEASGSLMGQYPMDDRRPQMQGQNFDRYYNAPNRMFERLGQGYDQMQGNRDPYARDPMDAYRRDPLGPYGVTAMDPYRAPAGPYGRTPADPYRLSREDYDTQDMSSQRSSGLGMYRRDYRGYRF
ncbi:tRNA (uracil-5-)-methyltransferase homolog A-like isoform X3 [Palaemon carinicauda]